MGHGAESENSYILKELESKLCLEDVQKWLWSMGTKVDRRRDEDLVKWLGAQTNLHRVSSMVKNEPRSQKSEYAKDRFNYACNMNSATRPTNCNIFWDIRDVTSCPIFISWNLNEKWNFVKQMRLCFVCLQRDHRRDVCTAQKYCMKRHHTLQHKSFKLRNNEDKIENGMYRNITRKWPA